MKFSDQTSLTFSLLIYTTKTIFENYCFKCFDQSFARVTLKFLEYHLEISILSRTKAVFYNQKRIQRVDYIAFKRNGKYFNNCTASYKTNDRLEFQEILKNYTLQNNN